MPEARTKLSNMPSVRRMPTYLHKLLKMRQDGCRYASTTELAEYMNVELIVVRKDISYTSAVGQRRVGYNIDELITAIKNYLGWQEQLTATLVGAGCLGTALLGYDGFTDYGLLLDSVFDADPEKIGKEIHGNKVLDVATMPEHFRDNGVPDIAVICVNNTAAQEICDRLVAAGVKYIWNFANVALKVPKDVFVQREVIAGSLAMLTVRMKNDKSQHNKPITTNKRKKGGAKTIKNQK